MIAPYILPYMVVLPPSLSGDDTIRLQSGEASLQATDSSLGRIQSSIRYRLLVEIDSPSK